MYSADIGDFKNAIQIYCVLEMGACPQFPKKGYDKTMPSLSIGMYL